MNADLLQYSHRRIVEFVENTQKKTQRITDDRGSIMLLLEDSHSFPFPDTRVLPLLEYYHRMYRFIDDNCYVIAKDAMHNGLVTECIHSRYGTGKFTGWENHCCNTLALDTQACMSVDFTAGVNIDGNRNNFHILALRAAGLDQLLQSMNELYGGTWEVLRDGWRE